MKNRLRKLLLLAFSMVVSAILYGGQPHHAQAAPSSQATPYSYGLQFAHSGLELICPGQTIDIDVFIVIMVPIERIEGGNTIRELIPGKVKIESAKVTVDGNYHGSITQSQGSDLLGAGYAFNYLAVDNGKDTLIFTAEFENPQTGEDQKVEGSVEVEVNACDYEVLLTYHGSLVSGPGQFTMRGEAGGIRLRENGTGGGGFHGGGPFEFKVALDVPDCSIAIGEVTSTADFIAIERDKNETLDIVVNFEAVTLSATGTCPNGTKTVPFSWDISLLGPARFKIDLDDLDNDLVAGPLRFSHTLSGPGMNAYSGGFILYVYRAIRCGVLSCEN